MRLALVGACLVLAVALIATGEHPSSVERLRDDGAAGSVASVQAYGYPTGDDGQAYFVAQVRWRAGVVQKTAAVGAADADSLVAELRRGAPELAIDELPQRTMSYGLYGIYVPL